MEAPRRRALLLSEAANTANTHQGMTPNQIILSGLDTAHALGLTESRAKRTARAPGGSLRRRRLRKVDRCVAFRRKTIFTSIAECLHASVISWLFSETVDPAAPFLREPELERWRHRRASRRPARRWNQRLLIPDDVAITESDALRDSGGGRRHGKSLEFLPQGGVPERWFSATRPPAEFLPFLALDADPRRLARLAHGGRLVGRQYIWGVPEDESSGRKAESPSHAAPPTRRSANWS